MEAVGRDTVRIAGAMSIAETRKHDRDRGSTTAIVAATQSTVSGPNTLDRAAVA
jgi:hypothetical protein